MNRRFAPPLRGLGARGERAQPVRPSLGYRVGQAFGVRFLLAALWAALCACSGSIAVTRAAHGEAHLAAPVPEHEAGPALAILIGSRGLHAVDPVTRATVWRSPVQAVAHITADAEMIYVPAAGPCLSAISRADGQLRWVRELPGEAVIGVSAAAGLVVVATTGERGSHPGQLVGLSTHDGQPLWTRSMGVSPGVPAATDGWVALPLGQQLVLLDRRFGHELARRDLPDDGDWQRAEIVDRHLAVASPRAWLHLDPTGTATRFDWDMVLPGYDTAAADPGHDDAERLRWVPVTDNDAIDVVVHMRRAVLGLRARAERSSGQSHYDLVWLHLNMPGEEYVAATANPQMVTLVSENGSIVSLGTGNGELTWWWPRHEPTVAALFVGKVHGRDLSRLTERHTDRDETVTLAPVHGMPADPTTALGPEASLRRLFDDTDPRLDPLRNYVASVTGYVPDPPKQEPTISDALLAQGPNAWEGVSAEQAARSQLVDPHTPAAQLPASMGELCRHTDPETRYLLLDFVRLHHGDPVVVGESSAVFDAVRCLEATDDDAAAQLQVLLEQPWSDVRLRR